MRTLRTVVLVVLSLGCLGFAQMTPGGLVSSHGTSATPPAGSSLVPLTQDQMASKVAIRVNGTGLSELDVRREMVTIFPYATQHNGFPKDMEPQIRKGAVEMIIFEELLYQDAKQRKLTVPPERVDKALAAFRKQFPVQSGYDQYLKVECKGSPEILREKVRRSLLIEKMLKLEVTDKSLMTPAMVREYYEKNGKEFEHGETVEMQTISIIPPTGASQEVLTGATKKAQETLKRAKETKTPEQFGLIAEDVSDDDWHTQMGKRRTMNVKELPPMIATAIGKMKVGQISDLIQVGTAWVIIRLNGHELAGKTPFAEVQKKLSSELQKKKTLEIRSALNQRLRNNAKVEVL